MFYREELERKRSQAQSQSSLIENAACCDKKKILSRITRNQNGQECQEASRFSSFSYAGMRAKARNNEKRSCVLRLVLRVENLREPRERERNTKRNFETGNR